MSFQAREGLVLAGERSSPLALLATHTLHEVADIFFPSVNTAQPSTAQPRGSVWKPRAPRLKTSLHSFVKLCPYWAAFADVLGFIWVGHALESAPSPFLIPAAMGTQPGREHRRLFQS